MSDDDLSDESARTLRRLWFQYLDTVEAHRAELYRFALRLTGDVFAAEDLVQDTLLKGFGSIGRGDLHGETSKVRDPRAYLLRVASNGWIDLVRRQQLGMRDPDSLPETEVKDELPQGAMDERTRQAAGRLFTVTAPQERAALVLKEVFEFSNAEIAEILSTTEGAVKSALNRGRAAVKAMELPVRHRRPSKALLDRFVTAFNARDVDALTACLLENVSIEVQGVGGGRGRGGVWAESSLRYATGRVEVRTVEGHELVLHLHRDGDVDVLDYITRLEEESGLVARVVSYSYCPETVFEIARRLGLNAEAGNHHQPPATLARMIASTDLPWKR